MATDRRESAGLVASVTMGSAAADAGIEAGDRILALDGHDLHDVIDYQFYLESGVQTIFFSRADQTFSAEMDCSDGADPGIYFSETVFGPVRTCSNDCLFCFIEQVPAGLRPPLYLKDDDFRLSFLHGNFITLNNLRETDLERIVEQRLSPLYVSVHATDPEIRARLMGCGSKIAARGLDNLRKLGEAGIETHAQIVLCPGLNDGSVLERTVMDLAEGYSGVASAGIVPVAFSEEFLKGNREPDPGDIAAPRQNGSVMLDPRDAAPRRNGNVMPDPREITADDCVAIIDAVAAWQERFRSSCGFGFAYAADEFYLRAGRAIPPAEYYDDFAQYENGIGIARSFMDEGEDLLGKLLSDRQDPPSRTFLLTGTLAAGMINEACARLSQASGLQVLPLVTENQLFGPHVTVTGLLGGRDLLRAATNAGVSRADFLLIPAASLDSAAERFLDDLTLAELQEALECEIEVF